MEVHIQAVYAILGNLKRDGVVMQDGVLKRLIEGYVYGEIEYSDLTEETRHLIELNLPADFIKKGVLEIYNYLIGRIPAHIQKTYSVPIIEWLQKESS